MEHKFTVTFSAVNFFKSEVCEVTEIFIGKQSIGFIAENSDPEQNHAAPIVTPFTPAGLMDESHCVGCAAEQLFASHTGVPSDVIGITASSDRSPLAALLMAGVLSAAMKR
ncbi:TPA: hypothetical protein RCG84_000422 [Enterobacter roggenkampii]|uniref:hypothetical protein n=1 Tax=Enterobacter sp. CPE_E1241 TaxID=3376801 RepID=UPI0027EB5828|nr:hypothetical protein [Enterobacter roggenkampii]